MAVSSIEELKPVYLIFGDEELLLERALHRLRDRVASVADLDFNSDAFEGESVDPNTVVAAANTLPFGSEKRLIVVRSVDKMRADDQAVLAAYSADPSPSTCLVLVATKVAKSSKLYKAVDAIGGIAEYKAPSRNSYPGWVVEHFAARGRRIDYDGAELLVRSVGRDLRRLETEAEKIIAFAGNRTDIGRADVEQLVASTAPMSVFDFVNALGARECAAALERLDDLLASGEAILGIHAMAVRHIRTLVSVRALLDRGTDRSAMQREMGLQEWQLRTAVEHARRFSAAELTTALRGAADLEVALKTGRGDSRVRFEVWIVGVCRAG